MNNLNSRAYQSQNPASTERFSIKKSSSKKKLKLKMLKPEKTLLKVSKEEITRLSNIIQHSVVNKYYQCSNLKLLSGNKEYQSSLYTQKQSDQSRYKSGQKSELLQRMSSKSAKNFEAKIIDEEAAQKLLEMQQATQDIEQIQKQIQKKDQEQHEQLSRDVFQAMMTADQIPKMQVAVRTKDFICRERVKKDCSKDYLHDRVDVFFKEKLKEAEDMEYTKKYQRLLRKIASTASLQSEDQNIFQNLKSRPTTAATKFGSAFQTQGQSTFKSKFKNVSTVDPNPNSQNDDAIDGTSGLISKGEGFYKFNTNINFSSAASQLHSNAAMNIEENSCKQLPSQRKPIITYKIQNRNNQYQDMRISSSFARPQQCETNNNSYFTYQHNLQQAPQSQGITLKPSRPQTAAQRDRFQARKRLLKSASAIDILSRNMVQVLKDGQYISNVQTRKATIRKEKVTSQISSLIQSCQSFQSKSKSKVQSRQIHRNYDRLVRQDEKMEKKIEEIKEDIQMAKLEKFDYYEDEDEINYF